MPPFSRSEVIKDYAQECRPIVWQEHSIRSLDGTQLKLLESSLLTRSASSTDEKHIIVVYFQGNASSLPPRLPYLSAIIKRLGRGSDTNFTFVALSYRGFWKSKGRPNQKGIELDAQATLAWVAERYQHIPNKRVVLYGQSIGAGVATTAAATWISETPSRESKSGMYIAGLLLETPFTSLREMIIALYPQKFLPYRYLGPFLWSIWDSRAALNKIGDSRETAALYETADASHTKIEVLLLEAGNDELVPAGNALQLQKICQQYSQRIQVKHVVINGALHTNVMMKNEGKKEIIRYLEAIR